MLNRWLRRKSTQEAGPETQDSPETKPAASTVLVAPNPADTTGQSVREIASEIVNTPSYDDVADSIDHLVQLLQEASISANNNVAILHALIAKIENRLNAKIDQLRLDMISKIEEEAKKLNGIPR